MKVGSKTALVCLALLLALLLSTSAKDATVGPATAKATDEASVISEGSADIAAAAVGAVDQEMAKKQEEVEKEKEDKDVKDAKVKREEKEDTHVKIVRDHSDLSGFNSFVEKVEEKVKEGLVPDLSKVEGKF